MLLASGGTGTYTWSLTSGTLPAGLTLADGAIAGTPTLAGSHPFIATVTDSEGRVANYPGRIVVVEKLTISTLLLRPGKVGKLYGAKVKTLGGVKPADVADPPRAAPTRRPLRPHDGDAVRHPEAARQLPRDLRGHRRAGHQREEDAAHPRRARSTQASLALVLDTP